MHDLLESVCRYDVALILNHFISIKRFALIQLNTVIRSFHYDKNEKNRPIEITKIHLTKNCIIMSAAEMLCAL
jgi:hypothetical protein